MTKPTILDGRPPKEFTKAMHDKIIAIGKEGGTKNQMCLAIGITRTTCHEWIKKNGTYYREDFSYSLELALQYSQAWHEKLVKDNLLNKGLRESSIKWRMQNMFREDYSDTQEIKLEHGTATLSQNDQDLLNEWDNLINNNKDYDAKDNANG